METVSTKTKGIVINSTRLKGLVENIKKIEFHQRKATDLTECVLMQCADILSEAKSGKQEKTR